MSTQRALLRDAWRRTDPEGLSSSQAARRQICPCWMAAPRRTRPARYLSGIGAFRRAVHEQSFDRLEKMTRGAAGPVVGLPALAKLRTQLRQDRLRARYVVAI